MLSALFASIVFALVLLLAGRGLLEWMQVRTFNERLYSSFTRKLLHED